MSVFYPSKIVTFLEDALNIYCARFPIIIRLPRLYFFSETERRIPLRITTVLIAAFPHGSEIKRARIDIRPTIICSDPRGVAGTTRWILK